MSEELQPCWHCGKEVHIKDIIDEKGLLMHEFVCATGSSCLGSGLFTAFFPEKKETAIEQWNRRAPLYTPVNPEDITEGWYWHKPSVDDDAEIVHIRYEDGSFGMETQDIKPFITVHELYMWGGILFRIPEFPYLEVAE